MGWIAVLVFIVAVVMALRLIGPAVPNEIRMLTGPEGTTFHDDGLRYQEILGRHGVTVHLDPTSGSVENLNTLIEAEVPSAGFVWGLRDESGRKREVPEGVESLGTMYLQPLWVFASKNVDVRGLRDLSGLRVEAGEQGADSRLLAWFLLNEEGVGDEVDFGQDHPATPDQVYEAVQKEEFAAIIAVGEPDSQLIDILLRSPKLQVMSIERADAFAMQHRFLQVVRFPEGGHDIRANIPDQDLQLLAARVQLVVSDLFPPALADLLLQAASEVHGGETPFSSRGEFPSADTAPLPLNRAADNFYTNGPPKLMKYLPFRLPLGSIASWQQPWRSPPPQSPSSKSCQRSSACPSNWGSGGVSTSCRRSRDRRPQAPTRRHFWTNSLRSTAPPPSIKVPIRRFEPQWIELRQFVHDMRDRLESR